MTRCPTGKRVYRDGDTAWRIARALGDLGVTYEQQAYRCPTCGAWHTTALRHADRVARRRRDTEEGVSAR